MANEKFEVTTEELGHKVPENTLLVDVREPDEWAEGHIPGAMHLPLSQLQEKSGGAKPVQFPAGKKIIIYCRSGRRSLTAIEILKAQGHTGLMNLTGGILSWRGPVTTK